jgi:anti-sigma-K factor RskA
VPHEGCAAALHKAQETAALLALSLPPVSPPAQLWSAIEARTQLAGGAVRRRRTWVPGALAVLAAAAIVLLGWSLRERAALRGQLDTIAARSGDEARAFARCRADLAAAQADAELRREALALLEKPGTRLVGLAAQGSAVASANVILGKSTAYLLGRGLTAPAGKDYQLWMIKGAQKIPAGLLRGGHDGAVVSAIDPALMRDGAPDAIAVTLEAAGGRPQPEGPIVLVGKI